MDLLLLPTAAMFTIGGAWLDPERERPLIECLSLAGPLLGKIDEAQTGLVQFQNAGKVEHPEVRSLITQTTALDAEHDRLARGMHAIVSGITEISSPQSAEAYRALLKQLFPTGLGIVQQSYLVEAGDADLRDGRLSAESRRLLEGTVINTPDGARALTTLLEEWNRSSRDLGEAESKKAQLKRESVNESSRGPARKEWAKIVSHFIATLALEGGLSQQDRARLQEPLESAVAKARLLRAKAKKKGVTYDPETAEEALADAP